MTDRQFGFLLKMASEGRGDSHFVVKLATSPRMRREMGGMRPAGTSAAPTTAKPTAAAPARPVAAPAAPAPAAAPAATPAASAAPASHDPKRYGDMNYFNDRYKMYKDIATKYEANANAGKEKKNEGFNPSTVQNGAGFTPNRSNSLLDRVNALRAERERQAAEAGTNGSATSAVNEGVARSSWNQRFPNGVPGPNPDVFSNDQHPAAQAVQNATPGAAPMVGSSGRTRRARAYRQTPQMRAMAEEFGRLPQGRQLDLLRRSGVDLRKYMNASPKTRDSMIMSAYEYARGQRDQAAARRDAWRNAPGFVNGVKQIQPRRYGV